MSCIFLARMLESKADEVSGGDRGEARRTGPERARGTKYEEDRTACMGAAAFAALSALCLGLCLLRVRVSDARVLRDASAAGGAPGARSDHHRRLDPLCARVDHRVLPGLPVLACQRRVDHLREPGARLPLHLLLYDRPADCGHCISCLARHDGKAGDHRQQLL